MTLPANLVTQFTKAIQTEEKSNTETIVYGTTVESDGTICVRLDGSELLTPVSATADTLPGERVMVMIKNHTATITGNITSPAARSADLEDLTGSEGRLAKAEIVITNLQEVVTNNSSDISILQKHVQKMSVNYVSKYGNKDIWTYEQWNNGKAECWGRYTVNAVNAAANNLDGLYYSEPITIELPIEFDGIPIVYIDGGDPLHMHFVREFGSTETQVSFVVVCNDDTQTSINISVSIHVIGTYVVEQKT